jgi:hypothetical protein
VFSGLAVFFRESSDEHANALVLILMSALLAPAGFAFQAGTTGRTRF